MTANLFHVLGVEPILGRRFDDPATGPDTFAPAILGHRLWRRAFDGRSDVVGQTIWLDGAPHTVIGVMPQRFWYLSMNEPVWTVLDARRLSGDAPVDTVMRRDPGMTASTLAAWLQPGLDEYSKASAAGPQSFHLRVSGVEGTPLGHQVAIALPYVLGMSALLTLLIACANIATLMIAQWTSREHEIAIRASIGASRGRIVRALLTESVLLSSVAAAVGVCVTFALRGWVLSQEGQATFYDLSIDVRILLQTLAIALLAGIAAGVAPALYETRRLHANPLQRIGTADKVRQRWRHALVVFEITVTMALLVTAGAMLDGYERSRRAELGFSSSQLMAMRIEHEKGVPTARVLEMLEGLPGVSGAAASTSIPLTAAGTRERMALDAAGTNGVSAERSYITPRFFDVLGVQLTAGRPFSAADSAAARTAIVSGSLAARLFPGRSGLGETVWIGASAYEIVGIAADYSSNPLRRVGEEPRLFLPLAPDSTARRQLSFLVRAESEPAALVQTARHRVRDEGSGTVLAAHTLDQVIRVSSLEILAGTSPLFPLIAIGMLLTSAGIYGVLAFALTRRARELAIRVAIGATGRDLARLVAMHTLRLVAAGSTLGLASTFALVAVVRWAGGAGSIFDPPMHAFLVPLAMVVAIGVVTTVLPARRAARVDPAVLLRTS